MFTKSKKKTFAQIKKRDARHSQGGEIRSGYQEGMLLPKTLYIISIKSHFFAINKLTQTGNFLCMFICHTRIKFYFIVMECPLYSLENTNNNSYYPFTCVMAKHDVKILLNYLPR